MGVDRKGVLKSDQEKIAVKFLQKKNVPKLVARIGIKLIDNRLLDPLIDGLDQEKRDKIYKIIDAIFDEVEVSLASQPDPPGTGGDDDEDGD